MRLSLAAAAIIAALAGVPAGCGGDDKPSNEPETGAAGVSVVRTWADDLRGGDLDAATKAFAVPSRVANGADPVTLRSAADVRAFNESLPCGARLISTAPAEHGFLLVTFVLTERRGGGGCGGGVGTTARTAVRVRGGHITDWLRVADPEQQPQTVV